MMNEKVLREQIDDIGIIEISNPDQNVIDFTTLYPEMFLGVMAFVMLLMGLRYKNPRIYSSISFISLLISPEHYDY